MAKEIFQMTAHACISHSHGTALLIGRLLQADASTGGRSDFAAGLPSVLALQ